MHTPEDAQEGAQGSPKPFACVAMDFADTITVVIARPFVQGVADCAMLRVQTKFSRSRFGLRN